MLALLFFRGGGGAVIPPATQPGGGLLESPARRYSLRRKKKEYDFLKEIREDLAEEMYRIDALSAENLSQTARAELAKNASLAQLKYKKLRELAKTYQVSIDGIDAAIAFADERLQLLLDDEMMMIFTMIAAHDS